MTEHLSSKTAKELKEYAAEKGIDLGDSKTKAKILATILSIESTETKQDSSEEKVTAIISKEKPKRDPVSNSKTNDDGVIVSKAAERKAPVKEDKEEDKTSKVAIYSEKNMHWTGTGAIQKGYNIVTKEAAEKWLTRKGIRKATPEEVATYYGKN